MISNKIVAGLAIAQKKILFCIVLAIPIGAALSAFMEKHVYPDLPFMTALFTLVILDTILGMLNAYIKHVISSEGISKIGIKFVIYFSSIVTVKILALVEFDGMHPWFCNFPSATVYSFFILREAVSIFENIGKINPKLVPKFILKRLQAFDSFTGQPIEDNAQQPKQPNT